MSDSFLPPVLLELRANAAEFIAKTREAKEALGELGEEGQRITDELERAEQRQIDAQERLREASARTAEEIRADVDEQIEAERRLAEQVGIDYDEEGRRAQLTAAEVRKSADEQVAAQREVAESSKQLAEAQEASALHQEEATGGAAASFEKYHKLVAAATIGAAAIVGVESVKMAGSFQSQIELLHTAGGESQKNLALVANGVKGIAEATGTSLENLTEGAYVAEKAGYRGRNALEVLKMAAEGAAAENVPLQTSMQALSDVMLDYHMKASQAAEAENMIVKASGESKTTMDDFANSLSSVVPLASNLHVGFSQVAGAIATMTQHGQTAQQSTQNLANLLTNLGGQNNVASSAMQQLGINTIALQKNLGTRGLTGTLKIVDQAIKAHTHNGMVVTSVSKAAALATRSLTQMLGGMTPQLRSLSEQYEHGKLGLKDYQNAVKGMGGTQAAQGLEFLALSKNAQGFSDQLKGGQSTIRTSTTTLQKMLGGMTGMRVGMMLGGKNAKEFTDNVHGVALASGHAGSNISTWADTSKTLSVQLNRVKQFVEVLMVDIGQHLIPVVSAATGFFIHHKDVLLAVAGVIGGVLVVNLAAYAAKLAWSAAETVGHVATMVASWFGLGPAASAAVTEAGEAEDVLVAESEATGLAVDSAFGPIGLVLAGVGIAATLLASHWHQVWGAIEDVLKGAWNDVIRPVFDFIGQHWQIAVGIVTGGLSLIITNWRSIWGAVRAVYDDTIKPAFDGIRAGFEAIGDAFHEVWDNLIEPVFDFIKQHWGIVFAALTGGFTLLVQHWRQVWAFVKAAWNDTGRPLFDGIRNVIHTVVSDIDDSWNWLKNAARAVWTFLDTRVIHPIEDLFVGMWHTIVNIGHRIGGVFSGFWDGLRSAAADVFNWIARAWNDTVGSLSFHIPSWVPGVGGDGFSVPKMPILTGYANGGMVGDGWFSTGEQGPELGYKSGSSVQIFANRASQQMLTGAGGSGGLGGSGDQPIIVYVTTTLDGRTIAQSTERQMLRTGLRRGNAYAPFKK